MFIQGCTLPLPLPLPSVSSICVDAVVEKFSNPYSPFYEYHHLQILWNKFLCLGCCCYHHYHHHHHHHHPRELNQGELNRIWDKISRTVQTALRPNQPLTQCVPGAPSLGMKLMSYIYLVQSLRNNGSTFPVRSSSRGRSV